MIGLDLAEQLLDLDARMRNPRRAREQLKGAVALHNMLQTHGVAYLADEVGMGKTYVALGALALFRHFDPNFRLLVIAPRENIQRKWIKELRNFVEHNVRFPDLRVKALDHHPARPIVSCASLPELVREVVLNPDRDFFARMSSFSLPVAGKDAVDRDAARKLREGLKRHLPWVEDEVFDLHLSKEKFKDNFARAVCCALPVFDLVIVDEGHNLKHGFSQEGGASRNRVMALAFGHERGRASARLFPNYGPRAKRILILSATPVEETYIHLWNQLDVFGRGAEPFDRLRDDSVSEAEKKRLTGEFLVRRVTTIQVNGEQCTRNLYRREWRRGGVFTHDNPITVEDDRQRLVVALVQKKVSELLGHDRFGTSFQIGMLASFESFLETAKLKRSDEEASNFDDAEQTRKLDEREGIDVRDLNRLSRSYRERFGEEMPHPKMDAVVDSLEHSWESGRKALVFVRRVASVKDLKRKLDELYDAWLIGELHRQLPSDVLPRFERAVSAYRKERQERLDAVGAAQVPASALRLDDLMDQTDEGGTDTFFAWFFRGEGPPSMVSGANIQRRFIQRGTVYSTFFDDNHIAALLGCRPQTVMPRLCEVLRVDEAKLRAELRARATRYLGRARRIQRGERFEAAQAAAVEWLSEHSGPLQESARIVWQERYQLSAKRLSAAQAPDVADDLARSTFFTELRRRPELCNRLWPVPESDDLRDAFREREQRAQLLASAARLGHAFIDLYVLAIQRLGSLEPRAQVDLDGDDEGSEQEPIERYLDLLERQMHTPRAERRWGAFDELADIAEQFDLIVDVNDPDARTRPLAESAKRFGALLRGQQPVGGMSGQVNHTLVRQFRMPGYPLVLVTTDLLQEGEDLHTFCSSIYHYGISWTPSSMEQRVGRIDRVRSQSERRLSVLDRPMTGADKLQVYLPYLEDTVEVLQVQRVLDRMNTFLRLMHEDLCADVTEEKVVNVGRQILKGSRQVEQILQPLRSAFPVQERSLRGRQDGLAVLPEVAVNAEQRFLALAHDRLPNVEIDWEKNAPRGALFGNARLGARRQPFALYLRSLNGHLLVRCVSPVGHISVEDERVQQELQEFLQPRRVRVGAILGRDPGAFNLTVEDDVLLGKEQVDLVRVGLLLRRVVAAADRLEREECPGADAPLGAFAKDLREEGTDVS